MCCFVFFFGLDGKKSVPLFSYSLLYDIKRRRKKTKLSPRTSLTMKMNKILNLYLNHVLNHVLNHALKPFFLSSFPQNSVDRSCSISRSILRPCFPILLLAHRRRFRRRRRRHGLTPGASRLCRQSAAELLGQDRDGEMAPIFRSSNSAAADGSLGRANVVGVQVI